MSQIKYNPILEQMEQANKKEDLGNTKQDQILDTRKRPIQSKYWCFTLCNYKDIELEHLEHIFKSNKINYIMGLEIAPTTNTPHIQGYISAEKKLRPTQLKLNKKIHWEKIRGTQLDNIIYCSKGGNYRIHGLKVPRTVKTITMLHGWQQKIVDLYNTIPNGRTCHWIVDEIGGKGKSALCKYLAINYKAAIIQGGKLADIMNMIFEQDMDVVNCVFIDIPRVNENRVSYASIECILNGMITNTKYETGVKVFNPPHLVVFSNFEPETEHMSMDRWKITEITL